MEAVELTNAQVLAAVIAVAQAAALKRLSGTVRVFMWRSLQRQLGNFAPPPDFASSIVLQVSETKLAIEQREIFRDFLEVCDYCRAIRLGKRQRSQTLRNRIAQRG